MNDSLYNGDNLAYLEELQLRFAADPGAVDPATAALLRDMVGPTPPRVAPRSLFHGSPGRALPDMAAVDRQAKVARMINAYRVHGHRAADIDPLDTHLIESYPELDPAYYGLGEADLDVVVSTYPMYGMPEHATVRAILARLRELWCATVGAEVMNIRDVGQKRWVVESFETRGLHPPMPRERQLRILEMLTRADGFERFLGLKYQGYKRFSLEGGESIIPALDLLLDEAARAGVREVVVGMAHRGRLNVLLNILRKPPARMLAEFDGVHQVDLDRGSGDVKYHLGYSSNIQTASGLDLHVSLCFNPSHLEAVDGVVEGRVRAKQDRAGNAERTLAMPLLIHGDAAFAGQGVVAEVLNLSELHGYRTGGTIHVVINNQIGFTTSPCEGRSTPYSTDVARMLGVPIFHVNGEDPEQVAHVMRLAMEWRQRFHRDVVVDVYCFRKHGHNETDEPAYTQPLMYKRIAAHPGVREVYIRSLVARGVIRREEAQAMEAEFRRELDEALHAVGSAEPPPSSLRGLWGNYHSGVADEVDTTVPVPVLQTLLRQLNVVPPGFEVHPRLRKNLFGLREEQAEGRKPLDWAAAEALAYATLVSEGHRVRLSGQDCGRGTFSHRHAELVDQRDNRVWVPLRHLREDQAPFDVFNSNLSEAGVLAFEYGYTLDMPDALVIWEAQFGDFANGAQIVLDNFIVAGEAKWKRLSGLTLFLPHGYEGQGPEHSSARIERFLQMCAEGNIQLANCTTPAQLFHLLRRQVRRRVRDPLVVFTPKSQLRTMASPIEDLAAGGFATVIGDGEGRRRVVMCSGKVYYDLLAARPADVALLRVEQLYPFPEARLREELARHPGAELVWCQEEPKNMGPWPSFALWFAEMGLSPRYAGRRAAAAPATGYPDRHAAEQKALVEAALG